MWTNKLCGPGPGRPRREPLDARAAGLILLAAELLVQGYRCRRRLLSGDDSETARVEGLHLPNELCGVSGELAGVPDDPPAVPYLIGDALGRAMIEVQQVHVTVQVECDLMRNREVVQAYVGELDQGRQYVPERDLDEEGRPD